ncbi:MAG TPA: cell division protein FtsZ, partial [Allosphingosinicella sp.]|nr:cell division protein FtsZ [Allosphingosinicella sp.]
RDIDRMLEGAHMCFIAAGLGGGTGTGAAPVIARAARDRGILTVAVVTKPFSFEGGRRGRIAESGLEKLEAQVDMLLVIPNQNLFRVASPDTTFKQAFDLADQVLQQGVRGITDLMVMPGLINLDFADLRTIMADMGKAMMGTGEAAGEGRALRAADAAIANPLLDESVKGARGLIISITGGEDLGLMEVDEAASHIKAMVDPEADIIWGSAFDPQLTGRIRVSIVATGVGPVRAAAPGPLVEAALATQAGPVQAALPLPMPLLREAEASAPAIAEEAEEEEEEEALLLTEQPPAFAPLGSAAAPHPFGDPVRGPSLFEQMTSAARHAVARRRSEPLTLAAAE